MDDVIEIAVKKIKTLSFFVDEPMFIENGESSLNISQKIGFNLDKEFLTLILGATFRYQESEKDFMGIEVQNVFQIKNLRELQNSDTNDIHIPPRALLNILNISLSHIRALFAQSVSGTRFTNVLIPMLDPQEVAMGFFPHIFSLSKTANTEIEKQIKRLKRAAKKRKS